MSGGPAAEVVVPPTAAGTILDDRADAAGDGPTSVTAAIVTRRSVRAYLSRPVPRREIEEILTLASRTASNSNTQPWHVHVVTGRAKRRLAESIWQALAVAGGVAPEYPYQPEQWCAPLGERRRSFGEHLYRTVLGVEPDDRRGRLAHRRRNYDFFGAPVGLVLTVDRHALAGGLLDAGAFLQTIMLLARERGLDSCPQASFLDFHPILRRRLRIPDEQMVVCGLALGYADRSHPLDRLRTEREALDSFTTFHD